MTKFPTPEYKIDDESIYPPSEDTHLLLDALEKEKDEITIIKPSISVEIGCGSGVVTVFLNHLLSKSPSTSRFYLVIYKYVYILGRVSLQVPNFDNGKINHKKCIWVSIFKL
jgi:hypothetical protein